MSCSFDLFIIIIIIIYYIFNPVAAVKMLICPFWDFFSLLLSQTSLKICHMC